MKTRLAIDELVGCCWFIGLIEDEDAKHSEHVTLAHGESLEAALIEAENELRRQLDAIQSRLTAERQRGQADAATPVSGSY